VSKPSFPLRSKTRHRTPPTRDDLRRLAAAGLLGAAGVVTALTLADVMSGWALLIAVTALIAAPLTRWGFGLCETVAPLPPITGADLIAEVSTARIALPDHELALAGAVGVYRIGRHSLAGQTANTAAFPQVTV
jgi:hypothetical protein